ncbi:MAG TPA: hypothetical protein VKT78_02405 [Fimbriimonadaceae bacterium]|nr:hypothetical protein [Fimbriimonadaceae bacterium]
MRRHPMLMAALVALLVGGCAKFPTSSTGATTKRITFTMTIAGGLNPNYVYIVALNPSVEVNPTTTGPVPVVAAPWGNGFVAGGCTYFVQWIPSQSPDYGIFKFTDSTLNNFVQTGVPVTYVDPQSGGHVLNFTIDLSQIADSADTANQYQSLQVNFLTMDRTPRGSSGGSKNWDAIGDGNNPGQINDYLTIPLRTDGTYNNAFYSGIEPTGDVVSDGDPALDITDFSVQVQG